MPEYRDLYTGMKEYSLVNNYTNEVFFSGSAEVINFSLIMRSLTDMVKNNEDAEKIQNTKNKIIESGRNFFKNYQSGNR